jgi:hypothetical protein
LHYDYKQKRLAAITCGTAYRLVHAYDTQGRLIGLKQEPAKA